MLILHTSDWHLGRSLHRADLTPAFEMWCDSLVQLVSDRGIDAVLISGDVYDRAVPPTSAVTLFDQTLARLSRQTTVVVTSGNHDSPQRLGFGSALMQEGNVHIRTCADNAGDPVEICGKSGKVEALIYPIPYLDPDVERVRLATKLGKNKPLARSHEAVLSAALELIAQDIKQGPYSKENNIARIVMAHAFVVGGEPSESERDISVGGIDSVPSGLFRLHNLNANTHADDISQHKLSYVALGHLHSPQRVGTKEDPLMRYSGSPVPFSFGEQSPKSSVLLHVENGEVNVELIPVPQWRDVRTFTGTMEELRKQSQAIPYDAHPFARVILTSPSRPINAGAHMRKLFPHLLELQHRPSHVQSEKKSITLSQSQPLEILYSFMEISGNRRLTQEERDILTNVWEIARREGR